MKDFLSGAKGLSRNPLGIIGLFISLIYGFGSIVLTFKSELEPNEKLPLIWFLVTFPAIVLIAFVFLVVYHHKKLYGPGDYKDEKNFVVSYLPSLYQNNKIKEELDVTEELDDEEREQIQKNSNKDISSQISGNNNKINLNNLYSVVSETATGFHDQYLEAEKIIIQKLELELGCPIRKNVAINFEDKLPISVDGIGETKNEIIFIEIKVPQFGLIGKNFQKTAENLIHQIMIENQMNFKDKKPKILFAIGVQPIYKDILKKRLNRITSNITYSTNNVDFRIIEI